MKHGKTAAYTILKNELKNIEKWLHHTSQYDYRVLLDTGSTDGSWEYLNERAKVDPNLIIEQKIIDPWRFDDARNHNLGMVPEDVVWCLSPDLDEYYSINTIDEIERIIDAVPHITAISTDRLDLNSSIVRVGPPKYLPVNKIHRRKDYVWKSSVYEHLVWIHKDRYEVELYSDDIFLIHDQDNTKNRSDLYLDIMKKTWENDPEDLWNNWFLLSYYYKNKDFESYLEIACHFIKQNKVRDARFKTVYDDLLNIYQKMQLGHDQKMMIENALKKASMDWAQGNE